MAGSSVDFIGVEIDETATRSPLHPQTAAVVCVRSGSGFSCYRFVMLPAAPAAA